MLDGTVFDSTRGGFGRPATFAPNQVIRGWTEALQLMKEGEKWRLVIPSDLAYGRRGAGGKIPPDAALIFEIELVSVSAGGASAILPDWLAAIADRTVIEPIRVWHMFCFFVVIVVVQLMLPGGPCLREPHPDQGRGEQEDRRAQGEARRRARGGGGGAVAALAAEHPIVRRRAARSASWQGRDGPGIRRVLDGAHRRGAGPGEDGFRAPPHSRHREDDGREAKGRESGATRENPTCTHAFIGATPRQRFELELEAVGERPLRRELGARIVALGAEPRRRRRRSAWSAAARRRSRSSSPRAAARERGTATTLCRTAPLSRSLSASSAQQRTATRSAASAVRNASSAGATRARSPSSTSRSAAASAVPSAPRTAAVAACSSRTASPPRRSAAWRSWA